MRISLLIGALASLLLGFSVAAATHTEKWIHIDSAHFIVGRYDRYVDVWHSDVDGGVNIRLTEYVCTGHSRSQGFYFSTEC